MTLNIPLIASSPFQNRMISGHRRITDALVQAMSGAAGLRRMTGKRSPPTSS
jgi:hypothetical protein